MVLQHGDEVSVPFFAATQQLTLKADNPSSSILAGLLTSLGAVAPPSQRYSQHHAKVAQHVQGQGGSLMHGCVLFALRGRGSARGDPAADMLLGGVVTAAFCS